MSRNPNGSSICWDCAKAIKKCSWSKNFEPVEGWKAKKSIMRYGSTEMESYSVKECPLFERDSIHYRAEILDVYKDNCNREYIMYHNKKLFLSDILEEKE